MSATRNLLFRSRSVQSACTSPRLTWWKLEQASIWPRLQTPGGSSYWSPDWSRSCPCRAGTLASARPLKEEKAATSDWHDAGSANALARSLCWPGWELRVCADVQNFPRVPKPLTALIPVSLHHGITHRLGITHTSARADTTSRSGRRTEGRRVTRELQRKRALSPEHRFNTWKHSGMFLSLVTSEEKKRVEKGKRKKVIVFVKIFFCSALFSLHDVRFISVKFPLVFSPWGLCLMTTGCTLTAKRR